MATLYRRALGASFDQLPVVLRGFHDRPHGGDGRGTFRVTRGAGWLRNALARLMRLPRAGERVLVRLAVQVEADGERWVRHFDELRFVTRQWLARGLLVEALGPMRLGFRVLPTADGFRFELVRTWLWVIPLPRACVVSVAAATVGHATGWDVDVVVRAPLLGMLVRYQGAIEPC